MRKIAAALGRFVASRPRTVALAVLAMVVAALPGITLLKTEAGFSTMISPDSQLAQDNARYEAVFGSEPITVLLTGELENIFSSSNLKNISRFEQQFNADERYLYVLSPVTIIDMAAAEAIEAGQPIGADYLENTFFISSVLYEADGSLNSNFASLIPDENHVIIVATPLGNMSDDNASAAANDVILYFEEHPLDGVSASVVSDILVVEAISEGVSGSIMLLMGLAVVAMTVILFILFRVRWRLLSLLIVGVGALVAFGIMGYASIPISIATMAVLPILIGLGIDYAIQFQNRYQEEVARSKSVAEAIIATITNMFGVVSIALAATIIGFVTLFISSVPMISDFGVVLSIGMLVCFLVAIFLLFGIIHLGDRGVPVAMLGKASTRASGRIENALGWMTRAALKYPLPILLITFLAAAAGGYLDSELAVDTDYEDLVAQDTPALEDVRQLRELIGYGGHIRFIIEAEDVASPAVLDWLKDYQEAELERYSDILSVSSPVNLVTDATGGVIPSQGQINAILVSTPEIYVGQVVSADRTSAALSFTVGYTDLGRINELLANMMTEANPPHGVAIAPAGTLALSAGLIDDLVSQRGLMNIMALAAVFVILLLVYRRFMTAVFTIVPVVLVIAWASLDMYLSGIPINPLTAVLGVIIIGIGTEFMVLLLGRYNEEKGKGETPREAMITAMSKIGRAIVTTALTTLGGFGVLIASDFVMIRDFGLATVLGIFLCLLSTLVVMPPLIVWLDEHRLKQAKT